MKKKYIFPLILCLSGMVLNIYSIYLHLTIDFFANTPSTLTATNFWLISVILLSLSIIIIPSIKPAKKTRSIALNLYEKLLLVIILLFALILRLYRLNFIPFCLDEWYGLTAAIGILDGIVKTPFYYVGDFPTNIPAYPAAFFLLFIKNAYLAVRLPNVIFSILNIIVIFFFLKDAINKKTAFFSAILLSTSIWDIHVTQRGYLSLGLSLFLISGALFFMYRALKYYSSRDMLITGIFLGISINTLYIPALISIIVFIYLIIKLITDKNHKKNLFLSFILLITTFVVISPTLVKIYKYPEISIGRHKNWTMQNLQSAGDKGGLAFYFDQFKLRLNDITTYQENKYNLYGLWGVTLEPPVIILLISGLLYSLIHIFSSLYFILLLDFLIMFVPVVVIYHAESWWREIVLLPVIYIISAIGAAFIFNVIIFLLNLLPIFRKKTSLNIPIFVLMIFIYFISWTRYYSVFQNLYSQTRTDIYENYCKRTADYIERNIPNNRLILLPQEMCKELISIALLDKYKYGSYDSYQELENYLRTTNDVTVVKISGTDRSSEFSKNNPFPVFEQNLLNINPSIKKDIINDNNNFIYSKIFSN